MGFNTESEAKQYMRENGFKDGELYGLIFDTVYEEHNNIRKERIP